VFFVTLVVLLHYLVNCSTGRFTAVRMELHAESTV